MNDVTELASMDHAGIAAALRAEALLGGPDEMDCEDPAMLALWSETKRYMLGACPLLAFHLRREFGFEVVVLEARSGEQSWIMRHVAVSDLGPEDIAGFVEDGERAFDMPVVDAIGGGTFGDRLGLYDGFDEYRVVHADGVRAAYLNGFSGHPEALVPYDPAERMPGLALALGRDFDLARALRLVLDDLDPKAAAAIPRLDELEAALAAPDHGPRP